jgi:hypothetical protein
MTPILTISAKNLQQGVKYIPFQTDYNKENFMHLNLIKEVINLRPPEKKKIKKTAKQFIVTATSFLALILPTIASATTGDVSTVPTTIIDNPVEVTFPKEIISLVKWVLTISVGIGVSQALIMLIMSGMLRMIPNSKIEKLVKEWNNAILRGFLQVIIAAPLILLIWFVANKLLGTSGWFISPF